MFNGRGALHNFCSLKVNEGLGQSLVAGMGRSLQCSAIFYFVTKIMHFQMHFS